MLSSCGTMIVLALTSWNRRTWSPPTWPCMVAMLVALRSPSGAKKLYLTRFLASSPVSRLGIVITRTPRSR